jgi:hypothetical protein
MCLVLKATLCRAKCLSLFVRKFRQTGLRLCTHLYSQLHHSLYLDLNLNLNSLLYHTLLAKSYESLSQQMLAALFSSMLAAKNPQFLVLACPALRRQRQAPRQPVGRPLPGRIVSRRRPTTTYRRPPYDVPTLAQGSQANNGSAQRTRIPGHLSMA